MIAKPEYPTFLTSFRFMTWKEFHHKRLDLGSVLAKSSLGTSIEYEKSKNYRTGISEGHFGSALVDWFNSCVFTEVGVYSANLNTILLPDFLIYDSRTNFHLAIEVEEPYTYNTKEPIHYISENWSSGSGVAMAYGDAYDAYPAGDSDVRFRNDEISKCGWFVATFSEKLVVKQANECCKFLAERIESILGRSLSRMDPRGFRLPDRDPMWTYEEAAALAAKDYRLSYLGNPTNSNRAINRYAEYQVASANWQKLHNSPLFGDDY